MDSDPRDPLGFHSLFPWSFQWRILLVLYCIFCAIVSFIVWLFSLLYFWSWLYIPGISIRLTTTILQVFSINIIQLKTCIYFRLSIGFSKAYYHDSRMKDKHLNQRILSAMCLCMNQKQLSSYIFDSQMYRCAVVLKSTAGAQPGMTLSQIILIDLWKNATYHLHRKSPNEYNDITNSPSAAEAIFQSLTICQTLPGTSF